MTTEPDHEELLLQARLRAHIDGAPRPGRTRDWLDDIIEAEPRRYAATPPRPPAPPKATAEDAPSGEPRWDWRRLLHWPYARLTLGAGVALVPLHDGYSAATGWGSVLTQARAQAGVGAAWVLAGIGLAIATILVGRRRTWWTYTLLTSAFIGTIAMASPLDIVRLITGAF